MNTVYAPGSETTDETFVWYKVNPRLRLGLAYLSKQGAFRVLGSYQVTPETMTRPSVNVSAGLQGIGTGNPGYSATLEKNRMIGTSRLNAFGGLAVRSNEDRLYGVGGVKLSLKDGLTFGVQHDGVQLSPFVTLGRDRATFGLYLLGGQRLAYLAGVRF